MIKDFDEFERHFGALKQPEQKIDWVLVVKTAMVVFSLGLVIINVIY